MLRIRGRGSLGGVTSVIGMHDYRDFGTTGNCVLGNGNHAENLPFGNVPAPQTATTGLGEESICFDELHGKPPYNTGGPLFIKKTIVPIGVQGRGSYRSIVGFPPHGGATRRPDGPGCQWQATYDGGFTYGSPNVFTLPGESISSPEDYDGFSNPNDLSDLGSRAYNRLRPRPQKADIMQSLLELREVPRMLKTTAQGFHTSYKALGGDLSGWRQTPKGVSDQFLNASFGWKPFLGDLGTTIDVLRNADDYFAEYAKNNNRFMQRTFHEDEIRSEQVIVNNVGGNSNLCTPLWSVGLPNPWIVPNSVHHRIVRQRLTRVWYKGSFKYYKPEYNNVGNSGFPALDKARKMMGQLGLGISPTTLYRVTPWTWMIDWFVNVGDNVQRFEDSLTGTVVSKYFYLMRETIDQYLITINWKMIQGGEVSCSWTRSVTCKRRVGSDDHFSFSLLPQSLSGMQLAILAALGISQRG